MKQIILNFLTLFLTFWTFAQPVSLHEDITVERLMTVASNSVRIDHDPAANELYYVTIDGKVVKVNLETKRGQTIFSSSDHGLSDVMGFEIGATGNIYLVNAGQSGGNNVATVKKYADGTWTTMIKTTYPAASGRDHKFNSVIETLDQQYILVNSGSRTDHGDSNDDGSREIAITTKILKIPVTTENVTLPGDDLSALETGGYIYADGVRNTFDMEYAPNGNLFGVENSDTRDNEEELNWLQEGHHYGFPWRIGTHENPQQFEGYNPPDSDPLLVSGINMESTFYNDPDFPPVPGVTFTGPVINYGPDADSFRDTVDAQIKDGSEVGRVLGTFTPHSSPVGLTFDVDSIFGGDYTGKGFAISYNDASLTKYAPFNEPGEDLLMLDLTRTDDNYEVNIHRIVQGFDGPVDATIIGNAMYVLEYGGRAIWKVTFPERNAVVAGLPDIMSGLTMLEVFPNAFKKELNIRLSFNHKGEGSAEIYSLEGKKVYNLWEGKYQAGETIDLQWDGSNENGELANGIYFLKIESIQGVYQHRVVKAE